MTTAKEQKISIVMNSQEYFGSFFCKGVMMTVNSIYGNMTVHGTTKERAKATLYEIIINCPDLNMQLK